MQLARIIAISLLAAILAGGVVWLTWDLAARLGHGLRAWREARKKRKAEAEAEAEASMERAEEPKPDERPA